MLSTARGYRGATVSVAYAAPPRAEIQTKQAAKAAVPISLLEQLERAFETAVRWRARTAGAVFQHALRENDCYSGNRAGEIGRGDKSTAHNRPWAVDAW